MVASKNPSSTMEKAKTNSDCSPNGIHFIGILGIFLVNCSAGADVRHPQPGSGKPSMAAVVGSLDRQNSQFAPRSRPQLAKMEIITVRPSFPAAFLLSDYDAAGTGLKIEFRKTDTNDCNYAY